MKLLLIIALVLLVAFAAAKYAEYKAKKDHEEFIKPYDNWLRGKKK